jgi:citrate lyase beta subunit
MKTTLTAEMTSALSVRLEDANVAFAKRYPGESSRRQPVHTVYGGAHLFKADAAKKLGKVALASLEQYGPDFVTFARAIHLPGWERLPENPGEAAALVAKVTEDPAAARAGNAPAWLAHAVYTRVTEKLTREPVEDFRIDFEDGYGYRADAEEDGHAVAAAEEVAKGMAAGSLSPFIGIRIKPFTEELRARSFRTLDVFLTALVGAGRGLPQNFVVTLPKVQIPEQVTALAELFDVFEEKLALAKGALQLEIMIEVTQAILGAAGEAAVSRLVDAGRGRVVAVHFGTYDYTASCSIIAGHQRMTHPACDFAKHVMQVSLAGTGIWLSDGATNIMPVAPHRAKEGGTLTTQQLVENRAAVHASWRLHSEEIMHSLVQGYYQGWDLHPAQLPTRYGTVCAFFLEGLPAASERLRNFVQKAAQATLVGDVFDDAATGQGLLNFFLRGINCGAIKEEEALATGLTLEEIRGRSFAKIMENRRTRG